MALLGLGVVFVYSAGVSVGGDSHGFTQQMKLLVLGRHTLYAVIAVGVMILASRVNIRHVLAVRGPASPVLWVVVLSLGLVVLTLVPGMGRTVNGSTRWLYLGPRSWGVSFQPSEFVKWVMVLALAGWCTRRGGVMGRFWHGLAPALVLVGLACGLVMIEDLGTAVLIGVVAVGVLIAGGASVWQIALPLPVAAATVVAAIAQSPYRLARLTAFMDPWADPMGSGYHPIQSMVAIAHGGLWGRGLGNGLQKMGYLPEDTTDFIFAVICEELGLSGAGLIIGLYLVVIIAGLGVISRCGDRFGRLLGLGVIMTLGLQMLINIAVVTVLIPTKGIALPLVSAGGTGWVLTAGALGLVASLDEAGYCNKTRFLSEDISAVAS